MCKISLALVAININKVFFRVNPYCEPPMSKYNLYPKKSGAGIMMHDNETQIRMKILNLCDGKSRLFEIIKTLDGNIFDMNCYVEELVEIGLLREF